MQTQIDLFAASFSNEAALRGAIQDLLLNMPDISHVHLTHGVQEHGKDIVFKTPGGLEEAILCGCVVKNSKISGSVDDNQGAMTVMHQVRQALRVPYLNSEGENELVSTVYVITPYEITQSAIASMRGELQEQFGRVRFFAGTDLFKLFEKHYPQYLLLHSGLLTSYVSSLRQAFEDAGPLNNLSFKHGMLGFVRQANTKAYVKPRFYFEMREISSPRSGLPHHNRFMDGITANQLEEIVAYLSTRLELINLLVGGGCEAVLPQVDVVHLQKSLKEVLLRLVAEWEVASRAKLHGKDLEAHERQLVSVRLKHAYEVQQECADLLSSVNNISSQIARRGTSLSRTCTSIGESLDALEMASYRDYGVCRQLSRATPDVLTASDPYHTFDLSQDFIDHRSTSVLITGPPGYGKTSFCKWNALYDGERFASGVSNILPIYVALHRLSEAEPTDFNSTFLRHNEISKILDALKSKRTATAPRIRLYLDGLDEVTEARQKQLMDLARTGLMEHADIQLIVTARDHVTGPTLAWLPRVRISKLSEEGVQELVTQLLDKDPTRLAEFNRQLSMVPTLKPLLRIPLLCTLTTSVFAGATSLPESKAELYRIFVDLLCGGWDSAKGIKRQSEFSGLLKHRILIRLASTLQFRKLRSTNADGLREVIKGGAFMNLRDWEGVVGDIVQDGLLTRDGQGYSFSHLSFQEYLCARDLADPNMASPTRAKVFADYLAGDDWWRDVVVFYASASIRPEQMISMVREIGSQVQGNSARATNPTKVKDRVRHLVATIQEIFPVIGGDTNRRG